MQPNRLYLLDHDPPPDSCWSLSAGPDGRVCASSCCELVPGGGVLIVRYDEGNDRLETVVDVAEAWGSPFIPREGCRARGRVHRCLRDPGRASLLRSVRALRHRPVAHGPDCRAAHDPGVGNCAAADGEARFNSGIRRGGLGVFGREQHTQVSACALDPASGLRYGGTFHRNRLERPVNEPPADHRRAHARPPDLVGID
jgi:hypothetical protein